MTSTGPEEVAGITPETQFFDGDFAFKSFGLTHIQRLYGFVVCYATGLILSVAGTVTYSDSPNQPYLLVTFFVLWPVGTIVSFIGTGFLIEFAKQLKLMFKRVRIVATIVFLAMIAMTLVSKLILSGILGPLCTILVVLQYVAFLWYTLSYIPYARTAVL